MFTFPQIAPPPVFSSFGGGNIELAVGNIVVWVVIATLVGSVLAIAREALRAGETPVDAPASVESRSVAGGDEHREAA